MKISAIGFCIVSILLINVCVDAKKSHKQEEAKGKTKSEKNKKEVPIKVVIEKATVAEPSVGAPASSVTINVAEPVVEIEDPTSKISVSPSKFKLKNQKQSTEYNLCKQECRRKLNEANIKEYISQLEVELHLAKENLAIQEQATVDNKPTVLETESVEQPIIAVNTHQIPHEL